MPHLLDYERRQVQPPPSPMRWVIAGLLFLAAVLNYIDRQTLAQLSTTIQADLKLTPGDYANVVSLFLLAYTISHLISGRIVDWLGWRISFVLFISWWSIANMLTGFARSLWALAGCRFLLGLGEAGNWPASTKTVAEWFPQRERGTAIGIYTMGASIGATVAPWIIAAIVARGHWQWAFVFTGALGLAWVVPWILLSKASTPWTADPAQSPVSAETAQEPAESELRRWAIVLSRSDVWCLMLVRLLTDSVWYFYQSFFPLYLGNSFNISAVGLAVMWLIFLAADLGSVSGGLASGWLIQRGASAVSGRLRVMGVCAAVMPLSIVLAGAPGYWVSIGVAMVIVFAHLAWLVNVSAILVDVVPKRYLATAFGLVAAGSGAGGIAMSKFVGHIAGGGSYAPWFLMAGALHPAAWIMLWAWSQPRREEVAP